jgi:hypothetical protein
MFASEAPRAATPEENAIGTEYFGLQPKVQYDIRCIYIFAKIAFIASADVLFKLADDRSSDWRSAKRFRRRIRNPKSAALLIDFGRRFDADLTWFQAQVNFYRDDFVEHPVSHPAISGMISTGTGFRIGGLTGVGLANRDIDFLQCLKTRYEDRFVELARAQRFEAYEWMCEHWHVLSEHERETAMNVMRRVGLNSANPGLIVEKLVDMYARFLVFFSVQLGKEPLAEQAV